MDDILQGMNREQLAKEIWRACDIMRRDNNCGGVMEYIEHLSWVLFLKFLDEQEEAHKNKSSANPRPLLAKEYRWSTWVPKALGSRPATGRQRSPAWDDEQLMQFVHGKLIPYLASLTGSDEAELIAGIFGARNVIVCASAHNLREVLAIVDDINFKNPDDIHTLSHIYEGLLKRLGSENKLAGEFHTPRPAVRFMVQVISPKVGETIYDPACGACGFLAEAYLHMQKLAKTPEAREKLQRHTFFGQEKKPIPALLGMINMIVHGVSLPHVRRGNTLEEDTSNIRERFDIILTNPPFGGVESPLIQKNFPIKSNATELLFMEHIMEKLSEKKGARAGVVVPEGTLFRGGAFAAVKKALLERFDLFLVVSLPPGAFAPYSDVKTALLFFRKQGPTRETLYCELPAPSGSKKFSKSNPLVDEHFDEIRSLLEQATRYWQGKAARPAPTPRSWWETAEALADRGYDLTARNPTQLESKAAHSPAHLVSRLLERNQQLRGVLENIRELLKQEGSVQ